MMLHLLQDEQRCARKAHEDKHDEIQTTWQ